jgi:hypothetical protein
MLVNPKHILACVSSHFFSFIIPVVVYHFARRPVRHSKGEKGDGITPRVCCFMNNEAAPPRTGLLAQSQSLVQSLRRTFTDRPYSFDASHGVRRCSNRVLLCLRPTVCPPPPPLALSLRYAFTPWLPGVIFTTSGDPPLRGMPRILPPCVGAGRHPLLPRKPTTTIMEPSRLILAHSVIPRLTASIKLPHEHSPWWNQTLDDTIAELLHLL